MALKVGGGKVTNKALDIVEKRSQTVLALDEKAGLASALDAQIKEETEQLREIKGSVRELVGEVGIRQASGTLVAETPRFVIQDQLRVSRTLDEEALDKWLSAHKNITLKGRVFKTRTVMEVDEPELVRLVTEGYMTEAQLQTFYTSKESHAVVIKPREVKP